MPRVLTVCPKTGRIVPTQAVMTVAAFRRVKKGMAIYCAACGRSHLAERQRLWLEGLEQPLARPAPEVASELDPTGVKKDGASGRGAAIVA